VRDINGTSYSTIAVFERFKNKQRVKNSFCDLIFAAFLSFIYNQIIRSLCFPAPYPTTENIDFARARILVSSRENGDFLFSKNSMVNAIYAHWCGKANMCFVYLE